MESPSSTIVIVGGGSAGWMTAAALARFLPSSWQIRLIESETIGRVGVGEATIPGIRTFNASLGIDEAEFLAATAGTYKLGIRFEGWGMPGDRYIHAFGNLGRALGLIDFFPYWLRHRAGGGRAALASFMPAAIAAEAGRGGHSSAARDLAWAYHFDAGLYAAFLRRRAEAAGVIRQEGVIAAVDADACGNVAAVRLGDGRRIEGDLFVDCSGFAALLIAERSPFESYRQWLPCNRAVAVPSESTEAAIALTRAIAHDAGWRWRIPLQTRTGNGLVYDGDRLSDDEAAETLLAAIDGRPLADPRFLRFDTGRRREAWVGNVVAIGLSAGFLEPLESTGLHLIQLGIAELIQLLPTAGRVGGDNAAGERAHYNRRIAAEYDSVRDFIVAHYHCNARYGDLWRACRAMTLPDTLIERLALFRYSGRIVRREQELFHPVAWQQVLTGQGESPTHWHPLADALAPDELEEFVRLAAIDAARQAQTVPDHAEFIRARCRAGASSIPVARAKD